MIELTWEKNAQVSEVDETDKRWMIAAYTPINDPNEIYSVTIKELRANSKYVCYYFCENTLRQISKTLSSTSWLQPDNNGRLSILRLKFS